MDTKDFTTSIVVAQSPEEAFDAINNVRGWWSGEIDGPTDELGGVFAYRYEDMHRSVQKVTELVRGKRVVWDVLEASLEFVADKTEWNGTQIVFEINRTSAGTEVRFTHHGLVPQFECYGGCSGAWGYYIGESLKDLITTGKGAPNAS